MNKPKEIKQATLFYLKEGIRATFTAQTFMWHEELLDQRVIIDGKMYLVDQVDAGTKDRTIKRGAAVCIAIRPVE